MFRHETSASMQPRRELPEGLSQWQTLAGTRWLKGGEEDETKQQKTEKVTNFFNPFWTVLPFQAVRAGFELEISWILSWQ